MFCVFNKTAIGFAHVKSNKPCQDFSASYRDSERIIISACDGHGGDCYVRSDKGSKLALLAVMDAFMHLPSGVFVKLSETEITEKIKLNILCAWNKSVEENLAENPLSDIETENIDECVKIELAKNPVKAYGTTLIGAAVTEGKIVCVQIGDGGCFLIKQGELVSAFDYDGDPVANYTYSMCGDDAYSNIRMGIFDLNEYDGVICCTDGLINPYGSLINFHQCFVIPALTKLRAGKEKEVEQFIVDLGLQSGTGDDVSLSLIVKTNE